MTFIQLIHEVAKDNLFTQSGLTPYESVCKMKWYKFLEYLDDKRKLQQ